MLYLCDHCFSLINQNRLIFSITQMSVILIYAVYWTISIIDGKVLLSVFNYQVKGVTVSVFNYQVNGVTVSVFNYQVNGVTVMG